MSSIQSLPPKQLLKLCPPIQGRVEKLSNVQMLRNVKTCISSFNRFTTLLAAASAADLVDTLGADGSFTVFAPTNAAFDKVETERPDEA